MPLSGELNQILIFGVVFLYFKVVNLFRSYRVSFLVRYQRVNKTQVEESPVRFCVL